MFGKLRYEEDIMIFFDSYTRLGKLLHGFIAMSKLKKKSQLHSQAFL